MDEEDERSEEQEQIWSWGARKHGQLGTGKLEDELLPKLLRPPPLTAAGLISMLACGGAHVIALTTGGRVLTWGRGASGQLGHGDTLTCLEPKIVESLKNYIIVTHVSAGWSHYGFVLGNEKIIDFYAPSHVLWPPLVEDSKEQQLGDVNEKDEVRDEGSDNDKRLSAAMDEMKLLRSKYSSMEQHANMLHGLIFGQRLREHKITSSWQQSSGVHIARQWEDMLESV